jgi:glycosyltransferase involved in cell wall biosynthesis
MRVSVIVPCYQQAHFLCEAIDSVRTQTRKADEILVVAADAGSITACKSLDVAHIDYPPGGLSDARNAGIMCTGGDLILPLDADDCIEPTFLEKTVAAIEAGADVATSDVQEFGARAAYWRLPPLENLLEQNAIACGSLFRRELWEEAGCYDVAALGFEDWDYWLRCREAKPGLRVTVLREGLFRYRRHVDSMSIREVALEPVWRAMMRLRHPALYGDGRREEDLATVRNMPDKARERLRTRRRDFPDHPGLKEAARWAGEFGDRWP